MRQFISTILLMSLVSVANSCGEFHDREFAASREENVTNRTSRIEQLLPEDGGIPAARLGALIEAIRIVRPDIPKEELPLNSNAVRHVLQGMSVRELDRVRAILPNVIKRRQAEGTYE